SAFALVQLLSHLNLHVLPILQVIPQQLIFILHHPAVILRPRRERTSACIWANRTSTASSHRHVSFRTPPQTHCQQWHRLPHSPGTRNNRNRHIDERVLPSACTRPTIRT